jgi:hypothetical protein
MRSLIWYRLIITLNIIIIMYFSLVFFLSFFFVFVLYDRLNGVSLVLVGEDVIEYLLCSSSHLYHSVLFRLSFRLNRSFVFLIVLSLSSPLCCSLFQRSSPRVPTQVSNSVCLSCVCVYSCTVSRTHSSSVSTLVTSRSYSALSYNSIAFHTHSSSLATSLVVLRDCRSLTVVSARS